VTLSFRLPTTADYKVLASWIPDAKACKHWAGSQLHFPFCAKQLSELSDVSGIYGFSMVSPENELIGFGQFWLRNEETVHLGRVIVDPNMRGFGFGTTLCEFLIHEALNTTDAENVTLRVYRDNSAAISIYAKLGFMGVEGESNSKVLAMEAAARPSFILSA
jgi:RimJ/RimL family protein N-acetyltransferase